MMKNWIVYVLCLLFPFSIYGKGDKKFTVLQWNIWQEGTVVEGGYEAIVNEIVRLKPDFVTFSEVRNYNQTRFCDRIVQSLSQKGETYYSFYSNSIKEPYILDRLGYASRKAIFELKCDKLFYM